ncbi:MAG: hypothetical protein ABIC39_00555 [Pseudomonadota bacterium]
MFLLVIYVQALERCSANAAIKRHKAFYLLLATFGRPYREKGGMSKHYKAFRSRKVVLSEKRAAAALSWQCRLMTAALFFRFASNL